MRIESVSRRIWLGWMFLAVLLALLFAWFSVAAFAIVRRNTTDAIVVMGHNQEVTVQELRRMNESLAIWANLQEGLEARIREVEQTEDGLQQRAAHLDAEIKAIHVFLRSLHPRKTP